MTKTALAERFPSETETGPTPPSITIPPSHIKVHLAGQGWTDWLVRLPIAATPEVLKEPGIWAQFQKTAHRTFRKFDRLTIVSYDEDWLARATVGDARSDGCVLVELKVTALPPRFNSLLESEEYRIKWAGLGYALYRKSDDAQVGQADVNLSVVERRLIDMSPQRR